MCTTILYGCTSIKKPGVLEDHPPEMLHNPCVFMLRAALGFIKIIFLTAIQEDLFVVIPHIFISHEKHISTNSIIRRFSLIIGKFEIVLVALNALDVSVRCHA